MGEFMPMIMLIVLMNTLYAMLCRGIWQHVELNRWHRLLRHQPWTFDDKWLSGTGQRCIRQFYYEGQHAGPAGRNHADAPAGACQYS